MKNLYDRATAADVKNRLARLTVDSPRQWGRMNAAQAVAHLARGMEMATGDRRPSRLIAGRLFGAFVKRLALKDDAPFKRNSPTDPALVIKDDCDLEIERRRLADLIDRFVASGPAGCTTHPHSFFGRMSPDEWSVLTYKHLDHHFRQFGV